MTDLIHLASALQSFFVSRNWAFCFIGGLAVQRWGEPRLTRDVDVALLSGFGSEESFIDPLLATYPARLPDMRNFALQNRVLLLQSQERVPFDISLAALPFEESAIRRASLHTYSAEVDLITCSAEDLIVMKAFADREIDWFDIRGILLRSGTELDWSYIVTELKPLCEVKEAPHILEKLGAIRGRLLQSGK